MLEAFMSLITATALLLGSPGPAPLALAAIGATFGVNKGLPFLFGILTGLAVAIAGATFGIAALLTAWPEAKLILQVLGSLYIVYVAYKIASAPVLKANAEPTSKNVAPQFIDGFILNLLNPKAYAAFLALFSQFLLPFSDKLTGLLLTGMTCLLVATLVDFIWLCLGGLLRPVFEQPKQARMLRVSFAVLMLVAVVWVLFV